MKQLHDIYAWLNNRASRLMMVCCDSILRVACGEYHYARRVNHRAYILRSYWYFEEL